MTDKELVMNKGYMIENMLNALEDAFSFLCKLNALADKEMTEEVKAYYRECRQALSAEWTRLKNELKLLEKESEE